MNCGEGWKGRKGRTKFTDGVEALILLMAGDGVNVSLSEA